MATSTQKKRTQAPNRSQSPVPATVEITVRPAQAAPAGEDTAPLFYRGAEYWLPGAIVRSPLTPKVMRQLEKAQVYAVNGDRDRMLAEFRKTLVSTSDVATLVKVAAAAHSEGLAHEAGEALRKAVRMAERLEGAMVAMVQGVARQFGYAI